uniref:DRBM domain-containing protein n=1 Tax=Romanomermis culicivorax TaxID=13658 RepID=A0A915K170_ROMCU
MSGFQDPSSCDFNEYLKKLDQNEENANDENKALSKKMPVSYLQELCGRKKIIPIYEMRASEGQVHEPTYVFSVTIEDLTGMGRGRNKKTAKHYAALDALHRVIESGRYTEWFGSETPEEAYELLRESLIDLDSLPGGLNEMTAAAAVAVEQVGVAAEDGGLDNESSAGNPIGKLSETCSRRSWPQPDYVQVSETGMPHEKTFVVRIDLGRFSKEGTAKSKKVAKRLAAEAMLKFLNEMPLESRDEDLAIEKEVNAENDEEIAIVAPDASLIDLEKPPADDIHVIDGKIKFNMNGFGGSVIVNEDISINKNDTKCEETGSEKREEKAECIQKLEKIALDKSGIQHKLLLLELMEHAGRKVPVFQHLQRKSREGKFQCLLDLDDKNSFFGYGDSKDEAECTAAADALDLLRQQLCNIFI